jgi:hypothetical protein
MKKVKSLRTKETKVKPGAAIAASEDSFKPMEMRLES